MNPSETRRVLHADPFNYELYEAADGRLAIDVIWNHSAFYAMETHLLSAGEERTFRRRGVACLDALARRVSAAAVRHCVRPQAPPAPPPPVVTPGAGKAPWTAPDAPRIWRSVAGTPESYSDAELADIAADGFTGVWLFCSLRDLMQSRVFPELNRPGAAERLAAIQALIARAAVHRVGVYLYFNEPGGVGIDEPFWSLHPHLKGVEKWRKYALCTSTPEVQAFFRDAVASVLNPLHGLGGVLLITACEDLTHCWSKSAVRKGAPPPSCPRCRDREPAELILELLRIWAEVRAAHPTPFRILAWNWEWSYYYADPQTEIISRLPAGVELLLGFEMGGEKPWQGRTLPIGEYALSYAGPGRQFVATTEAVRAGGLPVHAKIEINNTHELCSVPNLPVLATLHSRFAAMSRLGTAGFLGCWSMGARRTLNTAALRLFLASPDLFMDETAFLDALARHYFGGRQTVAVRQAWRAFSAAFSHYPFTVSLLYYGPHNDAPARPLSLHYAGRPTGRSWCADEPGDDLGPALHAFFSDGSEISLAEIIAGFTRLRDDWQAALPAYEAALAPRSQLTPEHHRHRAEERCVAAMLAVQFRSIVNVFRFHRERLRVLSEHGLVAPCILPRDPELLAIMEQEVANVSRALPLVDADPRLGFHQDIAGYKYNGAMIRAKIAAMTAELCPSGGSATPGHVP